MKPENIRSVYQHFYINRNVLLVINMQMTWSNELYKIVNSVNQQT